MSDTVSSPAVRRSDVVFFSTGAAALVYETVWIRLLARLSGSDAGGLAVVLATFMAGMGLGALAAGGVARRTPRPVVLFAALEAGLGLWAAASPWMLAQASPVGGLAPRALLAALLLLPPTLAMGATFPLMARLTIARAADTGRETAAFYGANTLGAACGALLGPFLLMPALGLCGALLCAAAIDLLAAGAALKLLGRRAPRPAQGAVAAGRGPGFDRTLAASACLGLCGLGLEVLLARLLVSVTGASVYAYAIVLGVFLAGIGLGSRQLAGRARAAGARTLFRCALLLPALTLAGLLALRWQLGEADLFGGLANRMPAGAGLARLWAAHVLFAALALLPAALALGMALPSAAAALVARHPTAARERALARVYAWNTFGALAGSLSAAFVLLPALGPRGALLCVLACAAPAALLAPERSARAFALAALPTAFLVWAHVTPPGAELPGVRVVARHFGAQATATVLDSTEAGGTVRSLRVDGKVVASSAPVDLRLQRLLAYTPALLHGRVETALVIGLGTGMTAGALLDLPSLERLDVIEISAAVRSAAREFAAWNGGVLDDPRARIRIADGRHVLARSDERWDLITADPIHPWTRGSSDLYSLEHFERMAAHLAPGGVASQWLPLYQLSSADVRTVVATWCAAFPRTSAWLTAYDLALVGSLAPLAGEAAPDAIALPPAVAAHLAQAGLHSAAELSALLVADDHALRAFADGAAPMRDDRPVLEFRAPKSYLAGYNVEALRWAGRADFVAALPAASRGRAREVRGCLDRFISALPSGLSAAARRYGEELLALEPL